jgi:hypothetical protein
MTDVYDGSLDNAYADGVRDGRAHGIRERRALAEAVKNLSDELQAARLLLARYTIDEGHG